MMVAEPVIWGQQWSVRGCPLRTVEVRGLVWLRLCKIASRECSLSPAIWKDLEAVGMWDLIVSSLPLHKYSWPFAWFTLQFILPHYSYFPPCPALKSFFLNVISLSLPSELTMQKSNTGYQNTILKDVIIVTFAWESQFINNAILLRKPFEKVQYVFPILQI